MKKILFFIALAVLVYACNSKSGKPGDEQTKDSMSVTSVQTETGDATLNVDSMVKAIESENLRIESNLKSFAKVSLKTTNLRAQVKQKWSEIMYYSENGKIAKIVTQPYQQISQRTEEFTFLDGKLCLAIISDNGLDEKGNPEKGVDKEYYFHNDQCIKEDNHSKEEETNIRTSDSERLLQEAREYLELFPTK